ncbi:unnamed protein product, partial [Schistosoma turkestanicum]
LHRKVLIGNGRLYTLRSCQLFQPEIYFSLIRFNFSKDYNKQNNILNFEKMATRMSDMGMDVQINRRLNSKYDAESEAEAIGWLNQLTNENVPFGRENVAAALKNGQILIKLINVVFDGTASLPSAAAKMKRPFKANTMTAPFKQ